MRRQVIAGLCALALALVSGSGLALAGGWAVTTVETAPDDVVAGTTYDVEYTVLQHGERPVNVDDTAIQITSTATGETLQFPGRPTGDLGHYTAQVTFPEAGAWEWSVSQGMFGMQELGAVEAAAPAAGASLWTSTPLRVGLTLAALAALGLLCAQVALDRRGRREAARPGVPLPGATSGD